MQPRGQYRRPADARQVPLLLALERERPAKASPAAELLQRLIAIAHRHLSGVTGIVTRSPKCWQMILRGERPGTWQDLVEVLTHPSREARAASQDIVAAFADAARPSDGTLPGAAVAAMLKETSEAVGAYTASMDDGRLSVDDVDRILREVDDVQRAAAGFRAVLEAQRRRLSA